MQVTIYLNKYYICKNQLILFKPNYNKKEIYKGCYKKVYVIYHLKQSYFCSISDLNLKLCVFLKDCENFNSRVICLYQKLKRIRERKEENQTEGYLFVRVRKLNVMDGDFVMRHHNPESR